MSFSEKIRNPLASNLATNCDAQSGCQAGCGEPVGDLKAGVISSPELTKEQIQQIAAYSAKMDSIRLGSECWVTTVESVPANSDLFSMITEDCDEFKSVDATENTQGTPVEVAEEQNTRLAQTTSSKSNKSSKTRKAKAPTLTNLKIIGLVKDLHDALLYSLKGISVTIERMSLSKTLGVDLSLNNYHKLIQAEINKLTPKRQSNLVARFERDFCVDFDIYCQNVFNMNKELKNKLDSDKKIMKNINEMVGEVKVDHDVNYIKRDGKLVMKNQETIDYIMKKLDYHIDKPLPAIQNAQNIIKEQPEPMIENKTVECVSVENKEENEHRCYFEVTGVYNVIKCKECGLEKKIGLMGGVGDKKKAEFNAMNDLAKFNRYIRFSRDRIAKPLPSFIDRVVYNQIVNAGIRVLAGVVGVDFKENEPDNEILDRINNSPGAQNIANRALVRDLNSFMNMPTVQVSGLIRLRDGGEQVRTFTYKVPKIYADNLNEDVSFKTQFVNDTLKALVREYYEDEAESIGDNVEITFIPNLPNIRSMKMFGTESLISLFDDLNTKSFSHKKGGCVIDYIFNVYMDAQKESEKNKTTRFKNITRKKIADEFEEIGVIERDGISTEDIINWARRKEYVTVYAIDANLETYEKMIAVQQPRIILSYVSAHGHLYPISDKQLQEKLRRKERINFEDLNRTSFTIISDNVRLIQFGSSEMRDFINGKKFDVDCLLVEETRENKLINLLEQVSIYNQRVHIELNEEEDFYDETIKDVNVVDQVKIGDDGNIEGFVHPVSGVPIKRTEDFEERKKVCDYLKTKYDSEDFDFCDQSWSQIGSILQHLIIGKTPDTYDFYNDKYMEQYQPLGIKQILVPSTRDHEPVNALALDHKRCYTTALYNNEDNFPVYCELDDILDFTNETRMIGNAEYLVSDFKFEQLTFYRQWWTARDTRFLLENNLIKRGDITHYRPFRKEIAYDTFKVLIDEVRALSKELDICKLDKKIMNPWIGLQNKRYNKRIKGYGTLDSHEAFGLYASAQNKQTEVTFKRLDFFGHSYYILKFISSERVRENYTSIWRSVMSHANIYLIKKLRQLRNYNLNMCLYSVKIDALYLTGVDNLPEDDKWVKEEWNPPTFEHKGSGREEFIQQVGWNEITYDDLIHNVRSCMIEGPAGAGKTTFLLNLIKQNPQYKYVISSFMHAALCTIKDKIKDEIKIELELELEKEQSEQEEGKDNLEINPGETERKFPQNQIQLKTIDSVLKTYTEFRFGKPPRKIDFDVLIIDEVSMLNKKHITKLFRFTQKNNITVIGFGDMNQCPPVEIDGVVYDYRTVNILKHMYGNHIYMNFNPEYGRYDQETFEKLEYILKHRSLPPELKDLKIDPDLKLNITQSNQKKDNLNKIQGALKYKVGQKIIADYNTMNEKKLKKAQFFHSNFYYITEIRDNGVMVDGVNIEIPYGKFQPTNAITTYKYQGKTIEGEYNIYEIEKMSIREFYTAVSRCKTWKQWRFNYSEKIYFRDPEFTKSVAEKPAILNDHRIIKIGDKYHIFETDETVGSYCTKHGLDNSDQCEVIRNSVKCATEYGLNKIINKHKRAKYNIKNVAPNTLNIDLLKQKIPIKDNGKGLLSIRKLINGNNIQIKKHYNLENKEKVMEEMVKEQNELIEEYYTNLIDNKVEFVGHNISFKRGEFETFEIENIEMEEFILRKSQVSQIEMFMNSEKFKTALKWYYCKKPAVDEANKTYKRVIARQVHKLITETVVLESEEESKEEDEWICIKKEKTVYEYAAIAKDDLLEYLTQSDNVYEVFENTNTCLYTDLDLTKSEAIDFTDDPEQMLDLTLNLMKETALTFDVQLEDKFFRILSACTPTKISFHIIYLKEVFENNMSQTQFWAKAREIAYNGEYDDLFYIKEDKDGNWALKFSLDMGVYTRGRQMRAIYSEKIGKKNHLKPIKFENGEITELPLDKINIEDYLIERRKVFTSKLSGVNSNLNKKGSKAHTNPKHKNEDAIVQNINHNDPIVKLLINTLKNATDFNLNKIQIKKYTKGELICLERIKEGFCGCCERNHDKVPAKVWMYNKEIKWYGCMNTEKRISYY